MLTCKNELNKKQVDLILNEQFCKQIMYFLEYLAKFYISMQNKSCNFMNRSYFLLKVCLFILYDGWRFYNRMTKQNLPIKLSRKSFPAWIFLGKEKIFACCCVIKSSFN